MCRRDPLLFAFYFLIFTRRILTPQSSFLFFNKKYFEEDGGLKTIEKNIPTNKENNNNDEGSPAELKETRERGQHPILVSISISHSLRSVNLIFCRFFRNWATVCWVFWFWLLKKLGIFIWLSSKFRKERENKFLWNIAMVFQKFLGWWYDF